MLESQNRRYPHRLITCSPLKLVTAFESHQTGVNKENANIIFSFVSAERQVRETEGARAVRKIYFLGYFTKTSQILDNPRTTLCLSPSICYESHKFYQQPNRSILLWSRLTGLLRN